MIPNKNACDAVRFRDIQVRTPRDLFKSYGIPLVDNGQYSGDDTINVISPNKTAEINAMLKYDEMMQKEEMEKSNN